MQYSTEKPRPDLGLLPLPEEEFQKGKVDELHAMSNFRVRILPVLGPLPAMVRPARALARRPVLTAMRGAVRKRRGCVRLAGPRGLPTRAAPSQVSLPTCLADCTTADPSSSCRTRPKLNATLHRQLSAVQQKLTGDKCVLPFCNLILSSLI